MKLLYEQLSTNAIFMVAVYACTAITLIYLLMFTQGTMIILDCYAIQGKQKSDAENRISIISVCANVLVVIAALSVGAISNRVKLWKMLLLLKLIVVIFFSLMLYDMNDDVCNLSILFDISYIVLIGCEGTGYMVCTTMIARQVNEQTRGTMFAFRSVFASIFFTAFNGSAGVLYDKVSKREPFLIVFGLNCLSFIIVMSFGLAGKINL